jgi:hypothetical protein
MSSNESEAYKIMVSLDVDYVLVIFGGVIGYSGDDINKFLWMVRIAEGEHPEDIRVSVELPKTVTYFYKYSETPVLHFCRDHLKLNGKGRKVIFSLRLASCSVGVQLKSASVSV